MVKVESEDISLVLHVQLAVDTHNEELPNHQIKTAEITPIHNLLSFGEFLAFRGAFFGYFSCSV